MSTAVYIETFGCQMNVRDSELISGLLTAAGARITADPEQADVIVLNTCAVRERAEERVVGRVNQLAGLESDGTRRIGIVGCMAQHLQSGLLQRLPVLDFVVGPDAYRSLPETILDPADEPRLLCRPDPHELYEGLPSRREPGAVTAFVTVMRGCDRMCTFCVVPFTRGRERSRPLERILAEVRTLLAQGVREVTLLGQTVNAWSDGPLTFGDLLTRVGETGIERIRFTSPHPLYFGDGELTALADVEAVCEAVHLPMQSGNSRILKRMNRGYTREEFLAIADRLRAEVPEVTLGTDIIVGFPGESEAEFADTLSAMESCAFDSGYHFKYSPRPGTAAARRLDDDVREPVKQERLEQVIALQRELTARAHETLIGRTLDVLVDGRGHRGSEQWTGRTRGGDTVVIQAADDLLGRMVEVEITGRGTWTLRGRPTERKPW